MKKEMRLPDAELDVMQALWEGCGPMLRTEIEAKLTAKHAWSTTTVLSLLSRLEEKGFVRRAKLGKGYLYSPGVARDAYLPQAGRSFLDRLFAGSAKNMVAALEQNDKLSRQDIDELYAYLEKLKKEEGGQ